MDNQSGRTFENARIKLMAGDVSKIQNRRQDKAMLFGGMGGGGAPPPPVTEKSFDEYHFYTLDRPATDSWRPWARLAKRRAGRCRPGA